MEQEEQAKKQKKCVCAVLLLAEVLLLQTSGSLSFWNKIKKLLHLWQNILIFFLCMSCLFLVPSNKREYIISISPMTTKSYLCYQNEIGMFADERRDEGQKHLFFLLDAAEYIEFFLFSQATNQWKCSYFDLHIKQC